MAKLLFFRFRVTNLMLRNKTFHFEFLTRWVHFYFFTFELWTWRIMNLKLINEKNSLIITVSNWHGLRHSIKFFVFSLLCCKYIYNIYLSMLDFNGLCKFNNIWTRLPHASPYNYNEKQIELCHKKWFNCEQIYRV